MQMDEFTADFEDMKKQCLLNDVRTICNVGYDIESSQAIMNLEYSDEFETYAFAGIHPHYADKVAKDDLKKLKAMLTSGQFTGIGEIGIDRYWHKDEEAIERQKRIFRKQLEIARDLKLPVMLHIRDAYEEAFSIILEYQLKNINFHSFTGNSDELEFIVNNGYFFGINGIITFKNSNLKSIVKKKHFDLMLLETDAPYLAPDPHRGKRNRPYYIKDIYKFISRYYEIDEKELQDKVYSNFKQFTGRQNER